MADTPGPRDHFARPGAINVPEVTEWPDDEIPDSGLAPAAPARPVSQPAISQPPISQPYAAQPVVPRPMPIAPPQPLAPPPPPPPPKRSGTLTVVVIGALAATAVALIGVAIVASGKNRDKAADPPPATGPPVNEAPAFGPVSDIQLADNATSVVVTWDYPDTANSPIIVSAAPAGEPMRPLQSLPAGAETYTWPGLDPKRDYCVTVTIAYSADNTVMASPVCTKRKEN